MKFYRKVAEQYFGKSKEDHNFDERFINCGLFCFREKVKLRRTGWLMQVTWSQVSESELKLKVSWGENRFSLVQD